MMVALLGAVGARVGTGIIARLLLPGLNLPYLVTTFSQNPVCSPIGPPQPKISP